VQEEGTIVYNSFEEIEKAFRDYRDGDDEMSRFI
jgi:redox-sensitive bicupin YhaK (pirin superfamily)